MKPETIALQTQIEPGCGIATDKYPFAVTSANGRFKYLVLARNKEIVLYDWYSSEANGSEKLATGEGTEIPAASLIAELKAIISELEGKS